MLGPTLVVALLTAAAGCGTEEERATRPGGLPAATSESPPAAGSAGAPPRAATLSPAAGHADEGAPSHAHGTEAEPHEHPGEAGPIVSLSEVERENIGLRTETVARREIVDVRRFPGVIKPHPDRVALVTSRAAGRIVNFHVGLGQRVARGQDLIEVQSVEVEKLQLDLIQTENRYRTERSRLEFELAQAENAARLARADADRNRAIVEKGIGARKDLIAAENRLQAVLNEVEGARRQLDLLDQATRNETEVLTRQLVLLGLPREAIERVRREQHPTLLHVPAPLGGLIVERPVSLGQIVDPTTVLFRITDDSVVVAEGDAFEDLLPRLRIGQPVRVTAAAYPGQRFAGRLTFIHPVLDPQKRAAHVWGEIPNRDGRLRQDMFVELSVVVGGGRPVLAAPADAVIAAEGGEFVLVERDGGFARADIATGLRDDRWVEVRRGLGPGDRVVTDGKRQVYTKLLTTQAGAAAIGGHAH